MNITHLKRDPGTPILPFPDLEVEEKVAAILKELVVSGAQPINTMTAIERADLTIETMTAELTDSVKAITPRRE